MNCFATPPERLHYPQQTQGYGGGWNVTPDIGKLGMNMPVATIGGDIPIPVVFRFNASFAKPRQNYFVLTSNIKTGVDSFVSRFGPVANPILGTLHFGMILPAVGWYSGDVPNPPASQYANYWVLEDGTDYTRGDFGAATILSSNLYTSFGLAAKTAAVSVDSTGTVAFYPATTADLGTWASKVTALTSSNDFWQGFTGVPPGYQVIMDRDKARIFVFDVFANIWVPVLWVDRFGHWVSFQWGHSASAPSGMGFVETLTILNHRGKGLQVQSVQALTQTVQPLLRVDFINVQGPTLQVTGYSGTAPNEPSALGGAVTSIFSANGGAVQLRPAEVRIGNPAGIPAPSWMSVGLPQPSPVDSEVWPSDRVWTFGYDSQHAELMNMSDPMGVATIFTWTSNNLYSTSGGNANVYRSISSAVSTDSRTGVTLAKNYAWSLPATSTGTWVTSQTQCYSGTGVLPATASANTTIYTFASPSDPNYNNAAITNIQISNGSTTLSNTTITLPTSNAAMFGVDQTLSYGTTHPGGVKQPLYQGSTTTYPLGGNPNTSAFSILDHLTGHPVQTTYFSTNFQDVTSYTYDSHPELLDPNRLIQTSYQRTSAGVVSTAPSKMTTYNATTFLPTSSYITDSASSTQLGQNFTSYDSGGHLTGASNYASGNIFATSMGVATQALTVDLTSGLLTNLSVSYTDPASGWTDTYSQTSPLANYDTADRLKSFTDGLGVTTTTTYDALGRVTRATKGGQAEINTSYPFEWAATSIQNGRTTTTTLDGFGHVMTRLRGVDGVMETYSIDSNGRTVQTVLTSPVGTTRTSSCTFDARGRISTQTPPVGPSVSYTYSVPSSGTCSGDQVITQSYSGQSFTTAQTLDQWGQTLSSTDAKGTVTTATYDAMGHARTVVVTPSGGAAQTRTFTYNSLGLLTSKTEPETGTMTFGPMFDSHGLPTAITEGGGRSRSIAYDGLSRVRSVTRGSDTKQFNFNGLKPATFSASSAGQTVSVVYGYTDGYGRINSETVTPPSGTGWTQSYGYDPAGRPASLTYPDLKVVTYGYDDAYNYGRVVRVAVDGVTLATVGAYDGWGNLKNLNFASGANDVWSYTPDGLQINYQTITPIGASATTRNYAYDSLNHLTQAGEWASLTHDALGELTQATGMGVSATYAHDGYSNNINSVATGTVSPAFNNFTFNALPSNQTPTTAAGGALTGWSYNGNGEATSIGSAIGSVPPLGFGWDGLGRLSSTTLNGATESYAYLPSGCRVQLLDSTTLANNRRFAYTSTGKMLTEYTGSGSAWSWKGDVIYLGSLAIAEIDAAGTHELHSDHLGTPRIITSGADGSVEGTQAFGPFGESMVGTAYTTGYLPMIGYTGHIQTDPTGLIYMRGRFYSPAWHRFLNSDQGADPGQLNQSGYVGGGPISSTDPSGMWKVLGLDGGIRYTYSGNYYGIVMAVEAASASGYIDRFAYLYPSGRSMAQTNQMATADGAGSIGGYLPPTTGATWDAATKTINYQQASLPQANQPNPGTSMYNRFLDGYANAPKELGKTPTRIFNTASNIQTFGSRITWESIIAAGQCDAAGWAVGSSVFVNGLIFEGVILPATTLNFMNEAVKITLGVGNIFNDAY